MVGCRYEPYEPSFQQTMDDDYRVLRDTCPVHRDRASGAVVLTRFDDVLAAVHDHERFSSVVAEASGLLPMMIFSDQPSHTANRAIVSRAFTPKRVAEIEPVIREVANGLCDRLEDEGEFDFQHRYAAAVPAIVIGHMIGVPSDMIDDFARWTESFLEVTDAEVFAANATAIYTAFADLLAERRERPADDLMSALIAAEIDGEHLTTDELLGFCMLLILAGNDTTSSLIGNGFVRLHEHPDQLDRVLADPSLWSGAVEEMIRIDAPAQVLPRTTTTAVEIHGQTIEAGTRVLLTWGAANHDDREFTDPDAFDITRPIRRHLAFGHGIHHCLGANLARLEARLALQIFFERFPHNAIVGEPLRVTSHWARAHSRIPVRVTGAHT